MLQRFANVLFQHLPSIAQVLICACNSTNLQRICIGNGSLCTLARTGSSQRIPLRAYERTSKPISTPQIRQSSDLAFYLVEILQEVKSRWILVRTLWRELVPTRLLLARVALRLAVARPLPQCPAMYHLSFLKLPRSSVERLHVGSTFLPFGSLVSRKVRNIDRYMHEKLSERSEGGVRVFDSCTGKTDTSF